VAIGIALALGLVDTSGRCGQGRRPRPAQADPLATAGPDLGDPAPDLELRDLDDGLVRLSDLWSRAPVILVLGSYTTPRFRDTVGELERIGAAFGAAVEATVIYTIEAHPEGSESPYARGVADGDAGGVEVAQAANLEERIAVAREARANLTLGSLRVLVDGMDNAAWEAYGPAPNTAFLIEGGYVVDRQTWFNPVAMDQTLRALLRMRQGTTAVEQDTPPGDEGN
jgi:hypothetical protein